MIPIVVGHWGQYTEYRLPLKLEENLRNIGVDTSIELIQRSALLGTARILRKILEMQISPGKKQ